ncbi:MAG: DUF4238 domain-containing protein [Sedimentisphaerales bacterium]
MPDKGTRKQHILPRSYLERFAQEDKIWVLDFESKKQYQRNIKDAAIITDFYTVKTIEKDEDDIIEQKFLGDIESPAKDAIDHTIKARTFKDRPQWDYLANFTAQMYVRTPLFRQIILEIYEHSVNTMTKDILKDEATFNIAMQKIKDKIKPDAILSYEKALEVQKHSDITVDIPRTYYIKLMMEYANKLVSVIGQMTPHLFFASRLTKADFVTGDVPIIATPRKSDNTGTWLGNPNCDLYFPLSSKCCLVLNYDSLSTVIEIDKTRIAFINHLMAYNCTRIVLSENQNFVWMQENRVISDDIQHLIASWGPGKKTTPRAKIPDGTIPPVCRNDWNRLTSDDKD